MGSVGDDFQCPHCDVIGMGGYAMDGIDYPICTDGPANCLEKAVDKDLATRAAVKQEAAMAIIFRPACRRYNFVLWWIVSQPVLIDRIAEML